MKIIKTTKIFQWLIENRKRINLLVGGAGSSKSYSLTQFFIKSFYQDKDTRFLVTRKTTPALRISAYKLFIDLLKEYGWPYKLNKTEMTLQYGSNEILFKGMDDPEKIKSAEFNKIWMEEATEFTLDDFRQLSLRLRRKTDTINQMYLSCNPISALHWIKTELVDKGLVNLKHSTYLDNPFLDEQYIAEIKDLINQDKNYYKIYALGQWGVLENIIYSGWKTFSKVEDREGTRYIDGLKVDDVTYGLDFGYSNPACLVEINWVENNFIVRELLYQDKLTNAELIERVKKLIPEDKRYREIYADSSEPDRINEFYFAGFNIHKARKDVTTGIDYCKAHMLGVTADSVNGIKELQGYKRREDKDGHVMEEPVKFNDHFCDAMRYGAYSKLNITGDSKVADYSFR